MLHRDKISEALGNEQGHDKKLGGRPAEMTRKEDVIPFQEELDRLRFEQEIFRVFIEYARLYDGPRLKEFLDNLEKTILSRLLLKFRGNQRRTAKYLGIKYTTLHEKVKRHQIQFRRQPAGISVQSKWLDNNANY
jgi:DNA-binding NtrC family response regulator